LETIPGLSSPNEGVFADSRWFNEKKYLRLIRAKGWQEEWKNQILSARLHGDRDFVKTVLVMVGAFCSI
jgi:hypothetical protein